MADGRLTRHSPEYQRLLAEELREAAEMASRHPHGERLGYVIGWLEHAADLDDRQIAAMRRLLWGADAAPDDCALCCGPLRATDATTTTDGRRAHLECALAVSVHQPREESDAAAE